MYCNYCGKVIPEDANLCAYCGIRVGGVIARKRLVRPLATRKVAGVCAGFAEYFDLDVTLIRVVWVVSTILGFPLGIAGYVICWIVMPDEPQVMYVPQPGAQPQPAPR